MDKTKRFVSSSFFSFDKIPKIKICHMVAKNHPEVIEGRQRLIAVDVIDFGGTAEDASIDHDDSALDEEGGIGLVGAGVTEEVVDIQKALKYFSLSSCMLKPSHLITQGFEKNRTAQDNLFNHMFNFGAREDCREGRRVFSYYVDVETTKDQCRLLNPTPLYYIAGYTVDGAVSERALNRPPHRRLNFIDGSISSFYYILNFPE